MPPPRRQLGPASRKGVQLVHLAAPALDPADHRPRTGCSAGSCAARSTAWSLARSRAPCRASSPTARPGSSSPTCGPASTIAAPNAPAATMGSLLKHHDRRHPRGRGPDGCSRTGHQHRPADRQRRHPRRRVGFGARNLVKDFLSGIFMILEDQYGVGDTVDLGEAAARSRRSACGSPGCGKSTARSGTSATARSSASATRARAGRAPSWTSRRLRGGPRPGPGHARGGGHRDAEVDRFHDLIVEQPEVWGVERFARMAWSCASCSRPCRCSSGSSRGPCGSTSRLASTRKAFASPPPSVQPSTRSPRMTRRGQTFYDAIGGHDTIKLIVDAFYQEGVATDEVLRPLYARGGPSAPRHTGSRCSSAQYWGGPTTVLRPARTRRHPAGCGTRRSPSDPRSARPLAGALP